MTNNFESHILDSSDEYDLLAIHKAGRYNSEVVCYHVRNKATGAILICESLAYAEQRFDDLCSDPFYQGLESTLKRTAKV